jgi:exodeoxyribonuclease V alpha subunit
VQIPENATDIKWHSLATISYFDVELRKVIKDCVNNNNLNDFQILSPMYRGEYGVNKINEVAQDEIAVIRGVKDRPFTKGFLTYYIGDRVIQTVNNYDKKIFNGDMGVIIDAGHKILKPDETDKKQSYLTVKFYGNELMFTDDEIDQLKLAWCITIHKFQGSQAPNIMFVLSSEAQIMASKELVYTGMTRAEKHLDIYGDWETFQLAPMKSAIRKRYTNMNNVISELRNNKRLLKVLE